jgi:hypothetical protein
MAFILKKMVLGKARESVRSLVREGRLVFINAEQVKYTEKEGKTQTLTLDEFVMVMLEKTGLLANVGGSGITPVAYLGLDTGDFRKIIVDEYNRRKK